MEIRTAGVETGRRHPTDRRVRPLRMTQVNHAPNSRRFIRRCPGWLNHPDSISAVSSVDGTDIPHITGRIHGLTVDPAKCTTAAPAPGAAALPSRGGEWAEEITAGDRDWPNGLALLRLLAIWV